MEYTKIKNINEYVSESVSPMNTPEQIFEMYSVPIYSTGHPEYLHGNEIASNKVKVRKNDVLLCKINPRINRVWIVADESVYPCIASSEWIVIRNSEYNPEFLAWYFRSPKFKQLMTSEVTGIGGSLTRAQPKAVAEYPVPVIERQEQDVITEILNKIYNIIDARRREINILDDLIKARFVEMFGNPMINPMGWETYQLNDCLERIDNGKSFVCSDKPRVGDYPAVLKLSAVTYGDYRPEENKALLDENQFVEGAEVCVGDLLFTRKNTPELVGMAAYVQETPEKLMMPDLIFRLVTNDRMNPVFLWQLINCKEFRPMIQAISGGSAKSMSNISKERLGKIKVICPPRELQNAFVPFIKQVDKSKVAVQKSLDETQLLFNSLMQKYFG